MFAINPFSSKGSRFKRWDIERYASLSDVLPVIISEKSSSSGVPERKERQSISEKWRRRGFFVVSNRRSSTPLPPQSGGHVFGGDTGMMHLAALAGKPVLAIFGPTDHKINGPYGSIHRIIRKELPCSPCKNKDCKERTCLAEIRVDEVFESVLEMHTKARGN